MGKGVITFKSKGEFKKTFDFLNRVKNGDIYKILDKYGEQGVAALSKATPIDSGKTADSWGYVIDRRDGHATITWTNTNVNEGVNIAIILQYGHGTGTGGYVEGYDYINPSIRPIFDEIAAELRKEVKP